MRSKLSFFNSLTEGKADPLLLTEPIATGGTTKPQTIKLTINHLIPFFYKHLWLIFLHRYEVKKLLSYISMVETHSI